MPSTALENPLRGNVLASACPSRPILQHLTNRWGLLVMVALGDGQAKRFSELRRQIDGISERMLAQTLQYLEGDRMIARHAYNTSPPHVEYRLTALGQAAHLRLDALVNWIETNLPEIMLEKEKPSEAH